MLDLLNQRLDHARRDLLDLGLRNTLLNYQHLRTRGAELTGADPAEVFRLLVTDGRALALRPAPPPPPAPPPRSGRGGMAPESAVEIEPSTEISGSDEEANPGWEGAPSPAPRGRDGVGATPYSPIQLQTRLLNTYYTARMFLEEQGVNVLYVALGLLEWSETEPVETVRKAPLILVPVEISRSDVRSQFRLRHTGEEIGDNLSLRMKLEQDFGIELPELPGEEVAAEAVENYFRAVGEAVAGRPGWRVDASAVVLGFFSFSKLLMYRDLDPRSWPDEAQPGGHPVLQALLADSFHEPPPILGEEDDLDRRVDPGSLHPVVDADSSQTLAILDVLHGRNLVVQGPPGTGKSQTITNLIAEAVAADRTVLFVAEKMAALEVVKRNLDKIGLGVFALELHSHKTNKREVLEELRHTLALGSPILPQAEADLAAWQSTRDRLNAYCDAVNEEIGASGVRPHDAFGHRLRLDARLDPLAPPPVRDDGMADWSAADFRRREARTAELQGLIATIGPLREHPFFGSRVLAYRSDVAPLSRGASGALAEARAAASRLAGLLGLSEPSDLATARCLERAGQTVVEAPDLRGLDLADGGWTRADLPDLLAAGVALARLHAEYDPLLLESAWTDDVLDARKTLALYGPKWWRLFSGPYRKARRQITSLYFSEPPKAWTLLIRMADTLLEAQALARKLREGEALLIRLFRDRWSDLHSDWEDLSRVSGFLARVHAERAAGRLPAEILALLERPVDGAVLPAIRELGGSLERFGQATAAVLAAIDLDEAKWCGGGSLPPPDLTPDPSPIAPPSTGRGAPPPSPKNAHAAFVSLPPLPVEGGAMGEGGRGGEVGRGKAPTFAALPFSQQDAAFRIWAENAPRLQDMVAVNHLTRSMAEDGLASVVAAAEAWPGAASHHQINPLVDLLKSTWLAALLERAERERPELARFHGGQQTHAVETFRRLDAQTLLVNRARVARHHWERIPREGAAGQVGTLRREFEKKRRHLPIRQVMSQAGHAVQTLKPVFLMSPLSVAAYLPPGSVRFDLVIFDEASQVRPVDALGALLRGAQAVVVGDSQQLPPTTFFDKLTEPGAGEEDDDAPADLESVLGLFRARGAPERTLRWHYRSRHESLIAVSNRLFYEDRLVVFPSPDLGRETRGLVFHHLPDTFYEPGTSRRRNRGEAQAVARAVLEHARTRPELSLGVAAFSVSQAQAVRDEVELLRRQDPSCEPFFAAHSEEPFFVKNLENVQGDERDVIYISVGYGRTEEGALSHNFGPLNPDGGQRRLNVLISRARHRCEVFANFTADDLDLARTSSAGVAALKTYLEAAAGRGSLSGRATAGPVEAPFADRVAEALRGEGYEVRERIGVAGYFLDLAVVDPERPWSYLLGIECDGPNYRSARSSRDRERLRAEVLERLGWRLHRIWSPDWFRDPERELRRVVEVLERGKEPSPPGPLSQGREGEPAQGQTFNIARVEEAEDAEPMPPGERPAAQRRIEDISREEIRAAVLQVVEASAGISMEDLPAEAGRLLGRERVTRALREPIEAVIREMVEVGELLEQGGFLLPG